jgi:hypothetical protein
VIGIRIGLLCIAAAMAGCVAGGPAPSKSVPVHALYRHAQCGADYPESRAIILRDADAFKAAVEDLRRARGSVGINMPAVDFSRQAALLVQMGQKPTAGYGLWPEQPVARLRGDVLEVALDWQSPPPGAMLAQVVTSPCMLISIPRASYKTIHVLDATGQVRASTPVNFHSLSRLRERVGERVREREGEGLSG